MRNRLAIVTAVLICIAVGLFFFPTRQEAQITIPIIVGNTSDTVVAGACLPSTQGGNPANCSLRGAIEQANVGSSNSVIRFSIPESQPFCFAGSCTIKLTSALPTITAPASIVGPGSYKLSVARFTADQYRVFSLNSPATVSISGITITGGAASIGGAILNSGSGPLNITDCIITGNQAGTAGGGIYNVGTLNVSNSTIINNRSTPGSGGGVYVAGTVNITNSTLMGNIASRGGAIFSSGGALNLTNSTLTGNSANDNDGGGGIFTQPQAVSTVKSSIIAVNTGSGSGPDVFGNFVSAGFNLIGKRDGSTGFTTASTDQTGTIASPINPLFDPGSLGNNGGSTLTLALMPGSPALDKGTSSALTGGLSTDQRGGVFRRTFDGAAPNGIDSNGTDIGAFELQSRSPADFDGDNKTDVSIFRPSVGEWWTYRSSTGSTFATQFGQSTDRITPGDFTGDGKVDIAFWRPSNGFWFILRSENFTFFSFPFGSNGDVPAPLNVEGDEEIDEGVFRPSTGTWFHIRSFDGGSVAIVQFGQNGDIPVPGDYDGDGADDLAIYRPSLGQWWISRSADGVFATTFGNANDKPVQGDYTGDGKTDVAFYRPSTGQWFVLRSEDFSFFSFTFGTTGDIPAPGDYDGDGKFDAAVFRPSSATWFANRSALGTLVQQFGINGDRPIPSAFVP